MFFSSSSFILHFHLTLASSFYFVSFFFLLFLSHIFFNIWFLILIVFFPLLPFIYHLDSTYFVSFSLFFPVQFHCIFCRIFPSFAFSYFFLGIVHPTIFFPLFSFTPIPLILIFPHVAFISSFLFF